MPILLGKEYIYIKDCLYISLNTIIFHLTGFVFSESESTALEQFEGGPCAVIAPVQVRCIYYRNDLRLISPNFVIFLMCVVLKYQN